MRLFSQLNRKDRPPEDHAIVGLILWLAASFSASAFGAAFKPGDWYASLMKPSWNPPSWVFAPVWIALYAMMAVAAWLVWKRGGFRKHRVALSLFIAQLALNAAWSPLFFGAHSLLLSSIDIVILWCILLACLIAFFKVSRTAGWLLVPYQLWVTFAASLNISLWRMN